MDGIDLDPSHSFLHSAPPPPFAFLTLSPLAAAIHSRTLQITSRGGFGATIGGGILAFSGVRRALPGQLKMSWRTTILQCLNVGFLEGHLGCEF